MLVLHITTPTSNMKQQRQSRRSRHEVPMVWGHDVLLVSRQFVRVDPRATYSNRASARRDRQGRGLPDPRRRIWVSAGRGLAARGPGPDPEPVVPVGL